MNKEGAIRHLKRVARMLQGYSRDGEHMRLPGPSAGQAWEFGCEIEMALEVLDEAIPPLPTIEPHLLEVGK